MRIIGTFYILLKVSLGNLRIYGGAGRSRLYLGQIV